MVAAVVGLGVTAFQIEPAVVTRVSTPTGGLWIPSSSTGEIIYVDVLSGDVSARVPVAEVGAMLEVSETERGVVVLDRTTGVVSLVDPALHEVIREVQTLAADSDLFDIGSNAIVLGNGTDVAVVDSQVTESASFDFGTDVLSVAAYGDGGIASTSTELIPFDFDVTSAVAPIATTGEHVRLVRAGDQLLEVDEQGVREFGGNDRMCQTQMPGPDAQLVGAPSGWVVAIDRGELRLTDLEPEICRTVQLGAADMQVARPVIAAGRVFVPEPATGVVHIVDPLSQLVESHRVTFVLEDLHIRSRGEIVVAYSANSSLVTVLDADGVTKSFDTAADDQARSVILSEDGSSAVVGGEGGSVAIGLDGAEGVGAADDLLVIDAVVLGAEESNTEPTDVEDPESTQEAPADTAPDELIASYAVSAATVTAGTEVRFVDESTGSPQSWIWDFGDGTGAEGPQVNHTWLEPGTYEVMLFISRGEESAEVTRSITVVPADAALPPSADFTVSAAIVEVGAPISLTDRSHGEIDRWHWDFGDGTSATKPNAVKSWGRAGRYTVTLTVANAEGSDSATISIEVREGLRAPVAVVNASSRQVEAGEPVTFSALSTTDPAKFTWDFGDGRSAVGPTATQIFLQQGTYLVTVRASNDAGSSEASVEIIVVPPTLAPVARIANLPALIEVGDVVVLSSLTTNSPDTESWSFGDGQTGEGSVVQHSWSSPGTFLITLTATNSVGSSVFRTSVVVVPHLPPPIAVIDLFNASPWVGDPVTFTQSSLDATSWLWDFGDGGTSTTANPTHTFLSGGQKTITLTVSNRNGSNSATATIQPRPRPTAAFSVSNLTPRAGQLVTFTDLSVNAASWLWNFGDGTTSILQSPQHAYAAAGSYPVVLTVTSSLGDVAATLPLLIVVDPAAPLLSGVGITSPATTLEPTTISAVVAAASGPITTYQIDFGDGTPNGVGAFGTFQHSYAAAGSYVIQMWAQGPLFDWSLGVSAIISVVDPPPPAIAIAASVPSSAVVGFVPLVGEQLPISGPISTWSWEIAGPGGTVVVGGQTINHNFLDPGTYQLTLHAVGPVVEVTATRSITITPPPPPEITSLVATPSVVTTGSPVQFVPTTTGSVVQWEWDYQDNGTFVVGTSPGEHIFNTAGTHTVWLRVTGPYGQTDLRSVDINAHAPPQPSVPAASPDLAVYTTGDTVGFTSTELSGATVTTWDWNLDNGDDPDIDYNDAGPSISHTFNTAGVWTVTVTATGPSGASTSISTVVTVEDPVPPLIAGFTFVVGATLDVTFTDTSTGPSIDTWTWDFGDGAGVSSLQNPSYTYASAGSYTVTLVVTSGAETSAPFSASVTIPP